MSPPHRLSLSVFAYFKRTAQSTPTLSRPAPLQVRNSIEERILALQERKRLVFEATIGQDNAAISKLTEEDMRFLFSR